MENGDEMELEFHLVPASKQSAEFVWHIPDAVRTVLNAWRWTERPSETYIVLFQNKYIWETGASGRFYYEIYYDARTYESQTLQVHY